jgi:hypothetical protein
MSTTGLTDFNGIIHPSVIGLFPQLHKLGNVEGGVDVPINLVKGLDETQCMTTLHQLLGNPLHIGKCTGSVYVSAHHCCLDCCNLC